ncbi:MAG: SPFH/Band 7/PHB domain protein [Dehalococcoidia bacterium]|nr:SPFH/Band 7/PHB domain protein [Dehalococcoidia bacterium]
MGITIVRPYERVLVFRWGAYRGMLSQGFHWLWPIMDRGVRLDLRERVERVPTQKYITKDNVVVDMDFVIYWLVLADQAEKAVLQIENLRSGVVSLAFATLRAVIGNISLGEALSERERMRDQVQVRLDEVTGRWGVKVRQVEINEIEPPPGVRAAMEREKSASAIKTADITESEGKRQAAINTAQGEQQAAILRAEGERQATILRAEGGRQAAILNAEGYSTALARIFSAAKDVDAKTMSLQYFETLKAIGASPSTKFIFPLEFTGLLKPFTDMIGSGGQDR